MKEAGVFPSEMAQENVLFPSPAFRKQNYSAQKDNVLLPPAAFQAEKEQENVLLPQILPGVCDLQTNMDLLLETQESHYEDVE